VAAVSAAECRTASFPSGKNGAKGMSDIQGKVAREAMSECGQRASFNGAKGMSDTEGKVAREATSERSRGDASDIDGQTERSNGAFGKAT